MKPPSRLQLVAAFAAVYIIWGSTYLGILFAIESIPPLLMAGSRYFTAGVLMYVIARAQGAPRSGWADWRTAAIVGACLLLGGNGGVTVAEQYVASGLAAVIVATVPIYIALLGWLAGTSPRPTPIIWLGLAGGFCGVGVLLAPSIHFGAADQPHALTGMLILLFASFSWAAGSIYSGKAQNAPSPFLAAAQQMLCGGALLVLVGLMRGEAQGLDFHRITWLSIGAWIYLVLIGAIVGFTAYIWLLRHCAPAKVATLGRVGETMRRTAAPLRAREGGDVRLREPDRGGDSGHRLCRREAHHAHRGSCRDHRGFGCPRYRERIRETESCRGSC